MVIIKINYHSVDLCLRSS